MPMNNETHDRIPALRLQGLRKTYGKKSAVDGIDLSSLQGRSSG